MIARPKRTDQSVREVAVAELAKLCAEWCGGSTPEEWLAPLSRAVRSYSNGYEIARELERDFLISPDADLVEILDSANSHIWEAHEQAVRKWAAATGWKPSFSVGDRLSHPRHGEGVIGAIDEKRALYLFVPDAEKAKFVTGGGIHTFDEDFIAYRVVKP